MPDQKPEQKPAGQPQPGQPAQPQPKQEPQPASRQEPAQDAPEPKEADLAPAGESSDPEVHQALAEREIAASNDDDDGVKAADERLKELGVKV